MHARPPFSLNTPRASTHERVAISLRLEIHLPPRRTCWQFIEDPYPLHCTLWTANVSITGPIWNKLRLTAAKFYHSPPGEEKLESGVRELAAARRPPFPRSFNSRSLNRTRAQGGGGGGFSLRPQHLLYTSRFACSPLSPPQGGGELD